MKKLFQVSAIALAAMLAVAVVAESVQAQPGGRGRGGPGFGGGTMGLLQNEQVREELGIVDDQMEEIRALGEEMRDEMRSVFQGLRDLPEDERRAAFEGMREKMEGLRADMESKMNRVLLPHQVDRLKQINVQMDVQRRGVAGALEGGSLAEELNLTEAQMEQLREKAEKVQEDLRKKIEELRAKAQDDILGVLTPEQRATYKKLVGEAFEMEFRGFRGRGGPGGGPGGRGGPGGGRPD